MKTYRRGTAKPLRPDPRRDDPHALAVAAKNRLIRNKACVGKKTFGTRELAERFYERYKEFLKGQFIYECWFCQMYHLGHQKHGKEAYGRPWSPSAAKTP